MRAAIDLVLPSQDLLSGYERALEAGWSSNNLRDVSTEELAALRADPERFLADQNDQNGTVTLGDGRIVPRLPFRKFWISDGEFCGVISFRHQPGTEELPPYCSGHVGYAIVPWKRRRGYATEALRKILSVARAAGMRRILVTCDPENDVSQKVILANGGIEAGRAPSEHGEAGEKLLFWIGTSP
jgi:predicted acetyltransferase